ncbi:MAG: type IV pilus modification protein PilV [Betaproteobacteria bacterium]|nr:MAG: type IV pilus modification protein PilV [Betaproteobacteria bacterium]
MTNSCARRQAGVAMMESLTAMAVLLVGLLGIVGLQAKTQTSHFEAYQRAQALLLLDDMVNRITANRYAAPCYAITGTGTGGTPYLGTDGTDHRGNTTCTAVAGTIQTRTIAERGMSDWDTLLKGAAEIDGGVNAGAMIGARGCVSYDPITDLYTVTVVWQGMVPTMAPVVDCANGLYGPDTQRRAVSMTVRIANLT